MMKYFVLLVFLPCMLAAEVCPDGTQCPEGKYCCRLPSGQPGCCDLPKDLEGREGVPGLPASSALANVSMAESDVMHAYCPGTQCGVTCIPNIRRGVCCPSQRNACPSGTKCCEDSYYRPWCCKRSQYCSPIYYQCLNGAVTTSIGMITVLFAILMGMTSKYYIL